jgi:hypothetical protein
MRFSGSLGFARMGKRVARVGPYRVRNGVEGRNERVAASTEDFFLSLPWERRVFLCSSADSVKDPRIEAESVS